MRDRARVEAEDWVRMLRHGDSLERVVAWSLGRQQQVDVAALQAMLPDDANAWVGFLGGTVAEVLAAAIKVNRELELDAGGKGLSCRGVAEMWAWHLGEGWGVGTLSVGAMEAGVIVDVKHLNLCLTEMGWSAERRGKVCRKAALSNRKVQLERVELGRLEVDEYGA